MIVRKKLERTTGQGAKVCGSLIWGVVILMTSGVARASGSDRRDDSTRGLELRTAYCRVSPEQSQRQLAEDLSTRLAFGNPPGSLGIGLCWWHSRFQRSAHELILFRPDRPRPDVAALKRAFDNREAGVPISDDLSRRLKSWEDVITILTENSRVVEIPGYGDLLKFSQDFAFLIVKRLSIWQLKEGILNFGWVDGITGSRYQAPQPFQLTIEKIYREVAVRRRVAFLKTRFTTGSLLGGHSWIVPAMERTKDGYRISVIDSQTPSATVQFEYFKGDDSRKFLARALQAKYAAQKGGSLSMQIGVPYLEHVDESATIEKTKAAFCRRYLP